MSQCGGCSDTCQFKSSSNSTTINIFRGLKSTSTSVIVKGTSMVCGSCPERWTSPSSCPWTATLKNQIIPVNTLAYTTPLLSSKSFFRCSIVLFLWHPRKQDKFKGRRTCFDCDSCSFCAVTCAGRIHCHKQAQTALLLSWTLFLDHPTPPNRLLSTQ